MLEYIECIIQCISNVWRILYVYLYLSIKNFSKLGLLSFSKSPIFMTICDTVFKVLSYYFHHWMAIDIYYLYIYCTYSNEKFLQILATVYISTHATKNVCYILSYCSSSWIIYIFHNIICFRQLTSIQLSAEKNKFYKFSTNNHQLLLHTVPLKQLQTVLLSSVQTKTKCSTHMMSFNLF